jgi:integral membrane protein 2B
MTILTKATNEKKPNAVGGEDSSLPIGLLLHPQSRAPYSEPDAESMVFNRPQFTCIKSVILFLISIIVMMMGVLGGYTLYRMFAPGYGSRHYHAVCDIPYSNFSNARLHSGFNDMEFSLKSIFDSDPTDDQMDDLLSMNYFREEVELGTADEENYAKINVPDFKDGRRGRFMHDFKKNQSAIIDTTANRCFIMPLDRETTLPPKSFLDLMKKMGTGYYNIDTERVRRNMRVVTPPISDLSLISERIANECYDMKVYMLEPYVSGVFKREAVILTDSGKFAEFSGKGIVEFDLLNIADIEEYEKKQLK